MTVSTLELNLGHSFIEEELHHLQPLVDSAHQTLLRGSGPGGEYTGWLNLPHNYNQEEFKQILKASEAVNNHSEALVVIGIGGSYLGARAAIEMLTHHFHNQLSGQQRRGTEIYFAGNNLSSTYLTHLLEVLAEKDFSVNVISKSGTTTEPAVAFRLISQLLEKKYGPEQAARRIFATTDREKGALNKLAAEKGYQAFVVPDDIGGRYSVLSAVGLLPIACSGIDIGELMAGAKEASELYAQSDLAGNLCYRYAAARHLLHRQGKNIEIMVNYEPSMQYFAEWWKQLFGESEGKDGKGIFPASLLFTTDLHSMGQYVQDGLRQFFQTVLTFEQPRQVLKVPHTAEDIDGLNFLAGKPVDWINQQAFRGSLLAHNESTPQRPGVPSIVLRLSQQTPRSLGHLFYFFEKACAISSYLLGVNPFDQPGVEAYKQNMFALLGKPGYEERRQALEKLLEK